MRRTTPPRERPARALRLIVEGRRGLHEDHHVAVQILNEAKLEASKRVELLGQLSEVVIRKQPRLLDQLAADIFELHVDALPAARKAIAGLIEEICITKSSFLPQATLALITLQSDSVPAGVKKTVGVCTALFKESLLLISRSADSPQMRALWKDMLIIKGRICGIASEYSNDGVRVYALKFVESLVLLYTPAARPAEPLKDNKAFDVANLPPNHPVLNAKAMGREAEAFLMTLLDKLPSPSNQGDHKLKSIVLIVMINSVSSVALNREQLFSVVVPRLLDLCRYLVDAKSKR